MPLKTFLKPTVLLSSLCECARARVCVSERVCVSCSFVDPGEAHLDIEVIKPVSRSVLMAHYCVHVEMITDVSLQWDDDEDDDDGDDDEELSESSKESINPW